MNFRISTFKFLCSIIVAATLFSTKSFAQAHAGEYMNTVNGSYSQVRTELWGYMSAVANNRSARKIEKRRSELLTSLSSSRTAVRKLPGWEGDISLRDSASAFLLFSYNMINQDYGKIVDMEEVAEKSYDAMEAYLLAIQMANAKFHEAGERLQTTQKVFAAAHDVTLLESEDDKLSQKIDQADTVMRYNNRMYLLVFKAQLQETYAMDAIEKKDISACEQAKSKLLEYSQENVKKASGAPSFQGDATLKTAAADLLNFYRMEAEAKIPVLIDFFILKENIDKMRAAIDAKPEKNRTKEEIDNFNKQLGTYNASVEKYNATINDLNLNRSKYLDTWNKTSEAFTAKHVPNK